MTAQKPDLNQHQPPEPAPDAPPTREFEGEFVKEGEMIVWDSLELREVPVKIAGEDYVLIEASAEDAKAWTANNLQSLHMRERGRGDNQERTSTFTATLADSEILLVSLCLYKVYPLPKGNQRVSIDTIRRWPNKLVETLFRRAQEISGLREEDQRGPGKNSKPGANSPRLSAGAQ